MEGPQHRFGWFTPLMAGMLCLSTGVLDSLRLLVLITL
jgi:hypothetical protein